MRVVFTVFAKGIDPLPRETFLPLIEEVALIEPAKSSYVSHGCPRCNEVLGPAQLPTSKED
jgi:hypothetical protein